MPTIADQVLRVLIEQEEQRCLAVEKAKGKPVRRRKIEPPVVRVGPRALCHLVDYLFMVRDFNYDLSDPEFLEYCEKRGRLNFAVPGSRHWKVIAKPQITKETYLVDPYFQYAQEHEGTRHRYTDAEMESGWKVISLARAGLQDCWELYRNERHG